MITKKLRDHAVYSDIEKNNLFLKKKEKYTARDFNKLRKDGWGNLDARFIIICTAINYSADITKNFLSYNFLEKCEINDSMENVSENCIEYKGE